MKVFKKTDKDLLSGQWDNSQVEIGLTNVLNAPPKNEPLGSHNYYQYYVVLDGALKLEINKKTVKAKKQMVIMVAPREKHRIVWVDPKKGAKWVVIKQKSAPAKKSSKKK